MLAARTGQPFAKVEQDSRRQLYMDAEEAIAYGIADKILRKEDVKLADAAAAAGATLGGPSTLT